MQIQQSKIHKKKNVCVTFILQCFVDLFEITHCFYYVLGLAAGCVPCMLISRCLMAFFWLWADWDCVLLCAEW